MSVEVRIRPLNQGEGYACTVKRVKELFKDTDIYVSYSMGGRTCGKEKRDNGTSYLKHHVKGIVIAGLYAHHKVARCTLYFYTIKESEYPKELQKEFESKYLPEFYRLYMSQLTSTDLTGPTRLMLVELLDGKLKLHETTVQ